ncbi:type I-U CRISPR-associated protein Cas7 [Corynebacterium sp. HMSC061H03]|nr:type I-U CRISPR-associated protein Cas7 [Corynebacterium sp. HMSC061H03]
MTTFLGGTVLTYSKLSEACSRGGANALTSVTDLQPAAGTHASVAPAKFVDRQESVFAFETRYIDGEPQTVVIIDSKQSANNRAELALAHDIEAGNRVLSRMPRMRVTYPSGEEFSDLQLPHRFADGHLRAATIDGVEATKHPAYKEVRNATTDNITALVNAAPIAAVFGAWDSTRPKGQLRLPSALVGEVIGVLADQECSGKEQQSLRGGARVDPLAMSVRLTPTDAQKLVDAQRDELSPNLVDKFENQVKKAKKGELISASPLGLGGIPPTLESLGGVSCRNIIRSWVLSFATLRQLRFGGTVEQDISGRALLAALGVALIARAEEELYLRANCHLVESGVPVVTLDKRFGETENLKPFTVEASDALLAEALDKATSAGVVDWHGQVLEFQGDPVILSGAIEKSEA